MQIAFLHLAGKDQFDSDDHYLERFAERHAFYILLKQQNFSQVDIIQRSAYMQTLERDDVTYHFIKDNLPDPLRWWQEPEPTFEFLSSRFFENLQVTGLNLPLHFRWIRRAVGKPTILTGLHTGEEMWPSRNLWLQQFGLRVVDGFVFARRTDAYPWKKASVILGRQPVHECPACLRDDRDSAIKLAEIYRHLNSTGKPAA